MGHRRTLGLKARGGSLLQQPKLIVGVCLGFFLRVVTCRPACASWTPSFPSHEGACCCTLFQMFQMDERVISVTCCAWSGCDGHVWLSGYPLKCEERYGRSRATSVPNGLHDLGDPRDFFFVAFGESPHGQISDASSRMDCIGAPPGWELSTCRRLCDFVGSLRPNGFTAFPHWGSRRGKQTDTLPCRRGGIQEFAVVMQERLGTPPA